jgi:Flp pilus assembly protein TadG
MIQFVRNTFAGAVIEFALVFPIFLTLFIGVYDFAYYILLNNKLARTSGTIDFIVSKQNISTTSLTSILSNAFVIVKPFDFQTNGTIITSQIGLDANNNMIINWQKSVGSASSRVGAVGKAPSALPGNLKISGIQRLIVTEVFYNYTPFFSIGLLSNKALYSISIYPPRVGQMDSLIAN